MQHTYRPPFTEWQDYTGVINFGTSYPNLSGKLQMWIVTFSVTVTGNPSTGVVQALMDADTPPLTIVSYSGISALPVASGGFYFNAVFMVPPGKVWHLTKSEANSTIAITKIGRMI